MSSRTRFSQDLKTDLCPETERKPVSGQANRYVFEYSDTWGKPIVTVVWARSFEIAEKIART